ncbi:MAG: HEPN domain-containing protein [Bacteroidales bacterium]
MKKENIKYRIKRARETYQDAIFLYEKGSINSSVNRLYYSAFYATIALLLKNGIEIKSHNGVKQKLGEEFVLKGLISKDFAKTYGLLSDYRHKGDYDDLFDFDKEVVERLLKPIKEYIDKIEEIISL